MVKVQTQLGKRAEIPKSVVLSNTDNGSWHQTMVRCKKCLRLKEAVISGQKEDEKAIIHQMGEMADFLKRIDR